MTTDARGNPISTSAPAALDALEVAMRQFQSYVGDAVGTIDGALAAQPDFMAGHVFRAGVLMAFAESRFAQMARESVAAAERLAESANDRERGLLAATRQLVDGQWDAACAAYERVIAEYPRDAFAIQTAHLFDFLRGDTKNLRDRVTRALPSWNDQVPGYSFILGMHAFGLEENNEYAAARATAERALSLEPRDGWAVHAAVHCCEMQGQVDDGVSFLEARRADWAPNNGFAYHNFWHLALFHLDRGDTARVLELFDTAIFPPSATDSSYQLLDATALLWRLHLAGVDVRERAGRVAAVWLTKPAEPGFYAFNDVHMLLALLMAGRSAEIDEVVRALDRAAGGDAPLVNVAMSRDVGLPVARAILAFASGEYGRTIELLSEVRDHAHRFGGSHAQRDILTLTLVEAALRANRAEIARHYLAERLYQRPAGGLGKRLLARADAARR